MKTLLRADDGWPDPNRIGLRCPACYRFRAAGPGYFETFGRVCGECVAAAGGDEESAEAAARLAAAEEENPNGAGSF